MFSPIQLSCVYHLEVVSFFLMYLPPPYQNVISPSNCVSLSSIISLIIISLSHACINLFVILEIALRELIMPKLNLILSKLNSSLTYLPFVAFMTFHSHFNYLTKLPLNHLVINYHCLAKNPKILIQSSDDRGRHWT